MKINLSNIKVAIFDFDVYLQFIKIRIIKNIVMNLKKSYKTII